MEFGLWYLFDTTSNIAGYSKANWASDVDDHKSTSGGCFYIGNNLISWYDKKQNSISLSTAEAEYIAADSGCIQLLCMKQMLRDYELDQGTMSLFVDNKNVIDISKNPVHHSRTKHIDTKHIDIRHHFICQLVEEKVVSLDYVKIEDQLVDILTIPLDSKKFKYLWSDIVLCTI